MRPGQDAGRSHSRDRWAAILVILIVSLACGLSHRFHARLDLSADRINTAGQATRTLIAELTEQVRIRYYLSPLLARRNPGPGLIGDYLRNLASVSGGRISLDLVDPAAQPGEAAKAGIGTGTISIVEKNQSRQSIVYSGIVVEYLDRRSMIPFIVDAAGIEGKIVKTIRALISDKDPEVAVLVGDEGKSLENDYSLLGTALANSLWKIVELRPGQTVPDSASLLLVLGNSGMKPAATAPVRDWLAAGKNAFFAIKGVDIEAGEDVRAVRLKNTALLEMLESAGIRVGRSLVLDRSALSVPYQSTHSNGTEKIDYFVYPHWIIVRPENVSRSGGLVQESGGLDLFWPSPLSASGVPGTEFLPLVMTGKNAWLQTNNFVVVPGAAATYEAELGATSGQYTLAASTSVVVPGVRKPARIIVVGSSDFTSDLSAMTGSTFNIDFVLRAIDSLASESPTNADTVPARKVRDRRFFRKGDPEKTQRLILSNYALNLVLIPGFIVAAGMIHVARRKKKSVRRLPGVAKPTLNAQRS